VARSLKRISLHVRPPEIEDRLVPGHWEGGLIQGAANALSGGHAGGTHEPPGVLARMLSEHRLRRPWRASRKALHRVHAPMRKTLTYGQGKEMSRHRELSQRTGVTVYFADPHSPWQRGSNENTNGLLRQYLPKGSDLSGFSQDGLDAIAFRLNGRPRKIHGFRSPLEVYAQLLVKAQAHDSSQYSAGVALGA